MISPEATLMDSGSYSDDSVCAGIYIKYTTSNAVIRVAPIPTAAYHFCKIFLHLSYSIHSSEQVTSVRDHPGL